MGGGGVGLKVGDKGRGKGRGSGGCSAEVQVCVWRKVVGTRQVGVVLVEQVWEHKQPGQLMRRKCLCLGLDKCG